MTKAANTESIEKATGITWSEWVAFLDGIGAVNMPHHEIVIKAQEHLQNQASKQGATVRSSLGWWAQSVTVAYEQHIGRRSPGQREDGSYEVTVSKTINGDMDDAMAWWQAKVKGITEFSGVAMAGSPETSNTPKWRYWRVSLANGTRLNVTTANKSPGKALFAVTSHKLKSAGEVEQWRAYWKQFVAS